MIGSALNVPDDITVDADSAEPITQRERDRDYLELKRRVTQAGLLDRQYIYYAWKIPSVIAMVAGSIIVMAMFSGVLWVQLLNAAFLALTFTNL